jgi:hypothetical protein
MATKLIADENGIHPVCGFCKDCKWWESSVTHGYCDLANYENQVDHAKSKATAWGREGAILETAPDFGCVQFEVKG